MATLEVPEKIRHRFIHAAVLLSMLDPVRDEASTQSLDDDPAKPVPTREQFLKRKFLDSFALICAVQKERDSVSAACMEDGERQGTIVRVASSAGVSDGKLYFYSPDMTSSGHSRPISNRALTAHRFHARQVGNLMFSSTMQRRDSIDDFK
jgi:hypothetical protein